jgi:hypothetical protein
MERGHGIGPRTRSCRGSLFMPRSVVRFLRRDMTTVPWTRARSSEELRSACLPNQMAAVDAPQTQAS